MPNPNKWRWSIEAFEKTENGWMVVKIKYPDCVNYEGLKILVYDNATLFHRLAESGALDPHFDPEAYSPVARFEPTAKGWAMAIAFADAQK